MSYYNLNAEISLDGIEAPLPVRLRGEGSAVDFDQEHSDARKGGVFEPVRGIEIPDFKQKNVTLVTGEKGSLLPRAYILEQVSRIREGWMFEAAINQKSNDPRR
jgi:hypothetical protein